MKGKTRLFILFLSLIFTLEFITIKKTCQGVTFVMILAGYIHLDTIAVLLYIFGSVFLYESCILRVSSYLNQYLNIFLFALSLYMYFYEGACGNLFEELGIWVCFSLEIYYLIYLSYYMKMVCEGTPFPFELVQPIKRVPYRFVGVFEEEIECNICLEGLKGVENCSELVCKHIFHKECIDEWLQAANDCPVCRTKIIF